MIAWSPVLEPALLAVAVVAVGLALGASRRALVQRLGQRRGLLAWWPRLGLGLLLLLALAGPRWRHLESRPPSGSLAVLVDTSGSMDLKDGRNATRLERARALATAVGRAAPSGMAIEILGFSTRLDGPLTSTVPAGPRPGDPAAILGGLATEPRLAGRAACVVISDGGDDPVPALQAPGMPVWILGVGPAEGARVDDLAVAELAVPATAEVGQEVPVGVEVAATGTPAFLGRLGAVPLVLEEREGTGWKVLDQATLDLRAGRARASFTCTWPAVGKVVLRARVPVQAGEASPFDNQRGGAVELRNRGLHVLYFTREIGSEFKALRQELGRDPGVTFTALLRTVASRQQGDRYSLLGERIAGDDALAKGFPTDAADLGRYGVVIIGAFPPEAWRPQEIEALRRHVDGGGAVVFLAGEACAAGGALEALLPMVPAGTLERGTFPLGVPPAATGQPVVEGLGPLFAGTSIDSLVRCAPPRPGASILLASAAGGRSLPVLAVQSWGRGRCALVASNTLWRLAGSGTGGEAYGRLWRQLVRWLGGSADEGGLLRVRWDKDRYRPGEDAIATVIPTATGLSLVATLTPPDGRAQTLALEPAPDLAPGAVRTRLRFSERGAWRFRAEALRQGQLAEALERSLDIDPPQEEGSRLVGDWAGLTRAATACGGSFAHEDQAHQVISALAARLTGATVPVERAPMASPWVLLVALGLLIWEWTIRRKAGLV